MKIGIYVSELIEELCQGLSYAMHKKKIKYQTEKDREIFKWHEYYNLVVQWIQIKEKNINLAEYLKAFGYKRIAIYGIGDIGKLCYNEILSFKEIDIIYIIDRVANGFYKGCPIILPGDIKDEIDAIDAIVITPIYCYLEIAGTLCDRTKAKLISLEDMIAVLNESEG